MGERHFEWYEYSDQKDRLSSEPDLNRVGYAPKVSWQVKKLNDEKMNAV
jgi:hypothetical protein